jgi:hypothetical protein
MGPSAEAEMGRANQTKRKAPVFQTVSGKKYGTPSGWVCTEAAADRDGLAARCGRTRHIGLWRDQSHVIGKDPLMSKLFVAAVLCKLSSYCLQPPERENSIRACSWLREPGSVRERYCVREMLTLAPSTTCFRVLFCVAKSFE